jgi:hypothetical protein
MYERDMDALAIVTPNYTDPYIGHRARTRERKWMKNSSKEMT